MKTPSCQTFVSRSAQALLVLLCVAAALLAQDTGRAAFQEQQRTGPRDRGAAVGGVDTANALNAQARQDPGMARTEGQPPKLLPPPVGQPVRPEDVPRVWRGRRAHQWLTEHRTWEERGGYTGDLIVEDYFESTFGQTHEFRLGALPLETWGGYPRFRIGGLMFSVIDPWPEYWSDDWYLRDNVYVDRYGNGYYLYNRRFPRDRVAILVSVDGR